MELALWNGRQRPAHGSSDSFLLFLFIAKRNMDRNGNKEEVG